MADRLAGKVAIVTGAASRGEGVGNGAAEAMAAFAVERYGRLDILHNNIGFGHSGTPETLELADWNRVFEANLTSAFMCCKACLPRMRAAGGGAVLNVSSTAGAMGLSGTDGG